MTDFAKLQIAWNDESYRYSEIANAHRKLTQSNYDAIRDHLFERIHKTGEEVKNHFPNILRAAIETEAWKHFADAEGKPFKNLVEWLHYTYPNGASMGQGKHAISYDETLKLTEAVSDVHRALKHDSPAGRNRDSSAETSSPRRGKPSIYTRLEEENPKAYNDYWLGRYKSITAAARAAGLVKEQSDQRLAREGGVSENDAGAARRVPQMVEGRGHEHLSF